MTMAVSNWLPLAAVLILSACERQQNGSAIRADVARVTRGPLEITFNEAATIAALRETTVKSEVEGQATLIHLVPEGTIVKQGEKLAELDASSLRQRLATQEIATARADAALIQAEKEHEILLKQNAADLLAAENEREFARMDLKKFLGREQPSLAA
jgi:multidrug efflux pump subunit AcrA (membrane-fusion protein)